MMKFIVHKLCSILRFWFSLVLLSYYLANCNIMVMALANNNTINTNNNITKHQQLTPTKQSLPPTLIKQPPHKQLFEVLHYSQRPFLLECEAIGAPEPTYSWLKNGFKFQYDSDPSLANRIIRQPGRGTLVFTRPQNEDEGLYQCLAENRYGLSLSNTVSLRAYELNAFANDDITNVVANESQPLTIACNAPVGYPKPTISWLIQSSSGIALVNAINDNPRLAVDPEGNLHFSNVTQSDMLTDAVYTCSVASPFKTSYRIGQKTHLMVRPSSSKADFNNQTTSTTTNKQFQFIEPHKQYVSPSTIGLKGESLELFCIFGGTPLPQIDWIKQNGLIRDFVRRTNHGKSLTFDHLELEDEGNIYKIR